ncbi:S8 family serine peptidase [Providencia rettgeri]|uniref:S8 family serine peptidase n=1 Tax=Providencia rettgeri TaxID=587 RepID=A0A939SQY6_PRORE|nr:S8 family serine peptidase [Providencia rettgeri]
MGRLECDHHRLWKTTKTPGNERNYTDRYSGTSSATPLCSGALALIQSYAKQHQIILSAWGMRELIRKSTYTEGVNDGIGYRPNVNQLLTKLISLPKLLNNSVIVKP